MGQLPALARQRHRGARARSVAAAGAPARGQSGPAHGGHPRQSGRTHSRQKGGCWGYAAGKNVTGRKRHLLVDTLGLVLVVCIQPASEQDRCGAGPVLAETGHRQLGLRVVWADGGYSGPLAASAAPPGCRLEIVPRPAGSKTFAALPRRWIVERTFAWLSRYRRLGTRDLETTPQSSRAWIFVAMIHLMCRRLHPH